MSTSIVEPHLIEVTLPGQTTSELRAVHPVLELLFDQAYSQRT